VLRKAIVLAFLLPAVLAVAQKPLIVHLPPSGSYAVFPSRGIPVIAPASPTLSSGGDVSVPLAATDDVISVWNKTTGNMRSMPTKQVEAGWTVKDSDLTNVAVLDVQIQQNGTPIPAAEVQLTGSPAREPEIIDPSSAGTVKFFNVTPGKLTITARVKNVPPVEQIFQLDLARTDPEPKFTISVAAAAAVGSAGTAIATGSTATPVSTSTAPPAAKTTEQAPGAGGVAVTYLLALFLAAGVGYGVFTYFKKNPGTVSEKLEQLGVQVPKPDNIGAAGGAPVPFAPQPAPATIQKIILDDAAPTPLSTIPYASPAAVNTLVHEPSLVSSSGVAIPLAEGETVVGRDAGLGLSLTGETSISRRHASIVKNGAEVTVNDLGSTNGTFVNGAKLQAPTTLRPGDSVQFGAISFRYQA
jgi:hypothetical protein